MGTVALKLTPGDAGRRMRLEDFEFAEVQGGNLYELARGVVVVSEVPNPRHFAQVSAIKLQMFGHAVANPGRVYTVASGSECKLLAREFEAERHPDLAVYKRPPPAADRTAWRRYIPEIIIEVVSEGSATRDYEAKREEYLAVGVKEYWIFDAGREQMRVLRRYRGRWSERALGPGDVHHTRLLPGLEFAVAPVFTAARAIDA
jgi:Uma2 family endonuclease